MEPRQEPDWTEWEHLVAEVKREKPIVKVGLVGKYVELHDAYMSVREALKHAALRLGVNWISVGFHPLILKKEKVGTNCEKSTESSFQGDLAVVN
jgi:CTP synthase